MNCNKKFAWLFVAILAITVLLVSSPTWAQQAPPSTHKVTIQGEMKIDPGVPTATTGQATPAFVLKKDESGRWVYGPNKEGASALGVPDNSASDLADELNKARRARSVAAKLGKSIDAIGKAQGEQGSRLEAHAGSLDGLNKAVAEAKKLAQQAVGVNSRANFAVALSALVLLVAVLALFVAMRRGPQAQEPEDKTSFIPREAALTPAPKTDEGSTASAPRRGGRGKGGDQPSGAPPPAPAAEGPATADAGGPPAK